mgnify:CR=1 FL=1
MKLIESIIAEKLFSAIILIGGAISLYIVIKKKFGFNVFDYSFGQVLVLIFIIFILTLGGYGFFLVVLGRKKLEEVIRIKSEK